MIFSFSLVFCCTRASCVSCRLNIITYMVLDNKANALHLGIYTGHEQLVEKRQNYITPLTIKSQTPTNDFYIIYLVHGYSSYIYFPICLKLIFMYVFMYVFSLKFVSLI